jgi:hypothetical protein
MGEIRAPKLAEQACGKDHLNKALQAETWR